MRRLLRSLLLLASFTATTASSALPPIYDHEDIAITSNATNAERLNADDSNRVRGSLCFCFCFSRVFVFLDFSRKKELGAQPESNHFQTFRGARRAHICYHVTFRAENDAELTNLKTSSSILTPGLQYFCIPGVRALP